MSFLRMRSPATAAFVRHSQHIDQRFLSSSSSLSPSLAPLIRHPLSYSYTHTQSTYKVPRIHRSNDFSLFSSSSSLSSSSLSVLSIASRLSSLRTVPRRHFSISPFSPSSPPSSAPPSQFGSDVEEEFDGSVPDRVVTDDDRRLARQCLDEFDEEDDDEEEEEKYTEEEMQRIVSALEDEFDPVGMLEERHGDFDVPNPYIDELPHPASFDNEIDSVHAEMAMDKRMNELVISALKDGYFHPDSEVRESLAAYYQLENILIEEKWKRMLPLYQQDPARITQEELEAVEDDVKRMYPDLWAKAERADQLQYERGLADDDDDDDADPDDEDEEGFQSLEKVREFDLIMQKQAKKIMAAKENKNADETQQLTTPKEASSDSSPSSTNDVHPFPSDIRPVSTDEYDEEWDESLDMFPNLYDSYRMPPHTAAKIRVGGWYDCYRYALLGEVLNEYTNFDPKAFSLVRGQQTKTEFRYAPPSRKNDSWMKSRENKFAQSENAAFSEYVTDNLSAHTSPFTFIDLNPGAPRYDIAANIARVRGADVAFNTGKHIAMMAKSDRGSRGGHPFQALMSSVRDVNSPDYHEFYRFNALETPEKLNDPRYFSFVNNYDYSVINDTKRRPLLQPGFRYFPGHTAFVRPFLRSCDRSILFEADRLNYEQLQRYLDGDSRYDLYFADPFYSPQEERNENRYSASVRADKLMSHRLYSEMRTRPNDLDVPHNVRDMIDVISAKGRVHTPRAIVHIDIGTWSEHYDSITTLMNEVEELFPKLFRRLPHATYVITYPIFCRDFDASDKLVAAVLRAGAKYSLHSAFEPIMECSDIMNSVMDPTGMGAIIVNPPDSSFDNTVENIHSFMITSLMQSTLEDWWGAFLKHFRRPFDRRRALFGFQSMLPLDGDDDPRVEIADELFDENFYNPLRPETVWMDGRDLEEHQDVESVMRLSINYDEYDFSPKDPVHPRRRPKLMEPHSSKARRHAFRLDDAPHFAKNTLPLPRSKRPEASVKPTDMLTAARQVQMLINAVREKTRRRGPLDLNRTPASFVNSPAARMIRGKMKSGTDPRSIKINFEKVWEREELRKSVTREFGV